MTPEEEEIRGNLGMNDEDILKIPALDMWELCRQVNALGDFFYRFYCIRVEELAKGKAEVRVALNTKTETEKTVNARYWKEGGEG